MMHNKQVLTSRSVLELTPPDNVLLLLLDALPGRGPFFPLFRFLFLPDSGLGFSVICIIVAVPTFLIGGSPDALFIGVNGDTFFMPGLNWTWETNVFWTICTLSVTGGEFWVVATLLPVYIWPEVAVDDVAFPRAWIFWRSIFCLLRSACMLTAWSVRTRVTSSGMTLLLWTKRWANCSEIFLSS